MSKTAAVRVPTTSVPILTRLAMLKVTEWKSLESALAAEAIDSSRALHKSIRTAVPVLSDVEVATLINDFFGQTSLATAHNWEPQDVAESLSRDPKLSLTDSRRETLAKRLTVALTSLAVRGLARAADVAAEHDMVLHTVRVLTDVRYVFDAPDSDPLGAVILHTLRLEYFDSASDARSFSLAMSGPQLQDLKDALDRAVSKALTAKRLLDKSNVVAYEVVDPGE